MCHKPLLHFQRNFSPVRVRFPVNAPALWPPVMTTSYDEATCRVADEDDSALPNAIRALKNLAWNKDDLKFYFIQAELKMRTAMVKRNYTKYLVLT